MRLKSCYHGMSFGSQSDSTSLVPAATLLSKLVTSCSDKLDIIGLHLKIWQTFMIVAFQSHIKAYSIPIDLLQSTASLPHLALPRHKNYVFMKMHYQQGVTMMGVS